MACVLEVVSPLFKVVGYGKQFLVVGIIPNFRSLEFSAIECYWSLVELGSIQIPIRLQ